ncbi:MAG: HAD-IB family hydrolase, partial [Chloroflexota bacterium]|nr:HAD-IB family hydrolase [Chloroflexota bacterium]
RLHRPYIRGWPVARLQALGEEAFAAAIAPRLSRRGEARVGEHRARGHLTALLSGAPPFLLAPLARRLAVAHVIGTPLAVVDGAYTGALAAGHPYGEEKAALARRFAAAHGVDLAASYAYADHHSDAPLLALFGHPVCVNPTPRLRRLAARFGWPVEEFR